MFTHRMTNNVITKLAGMVVEQKKQLPLLLNKKYKHYETKNFYSSDSNSIIYCL